MADRTGISWTDSTWNIVTGCTEVSPGCDHCYAKTFSERWRGTPGHHFENGFDLTLRPERLGQPLQWKRPRRIFVNSMSDLFHDDVPAAFIAGVFAVMERASQHTFQILTKRHGRMRSLLSSYEFRADVDTHRQAIQPGCGDFVWPLPNVWLGVSVEDQRWADIRIPALLGTPAAVRFLSCEPMLGPIDLSQFLRFHGISGGLGLGWVIAGGESGNGARPMELDWAQNIASQCDDASVPFFMKQLGTVLARQHGIAGKGDKPREWPIPFRQDFPRPLAVAAPS